jgi:hypothetical protein
VLEGSCLEVAQVVGPVVGWLAHEPILRAPGRGRQC